MVEDSTVSTVSIPYSTVVIALVKSWFQILGGTITVSIVSERQPWRHGQAQLQVSASSLP
jgi:hypothetical protein